MLDLQKSRTTAVYTSDLGRRRKQAASTMSSYARNTDATALKSGEVGPKSQLTPNSSVKSAARIKSLHEPGPMQVQFIPQTGSSSIQEALNHRHARSQQQKHRVYTKKKRGAFPWQTTQSTAFPAGPAADENVYNDTQTLGTTGGQALSLKPSQMEAQLGFNSQQSSPMTLIQVANSRNFKNQQTISNFKQISDQIKSTYDNQRTQVSDKEHFGPVIEHNYLNHTNGKSSNDSARWPKGRNSKAQPALTNGFKVHPLEGMNVVRYKK